MNVSRTIKTTLSAALLAGLFAGGAVAAADAGAPIVYGGFTESNGVTLPVDVSGYGSTRQGIAASTAGTRVFGVFERDSSGVTVPSAGSPRDAVTLPRVTVVANPDSGLIYGAFRRIDGVTLPASRDRSSTALDLTEAAIAARDIR